MSSFFGNSTPQNFYIGSSHVQKLYLGNQEVWPGVNTTPSLTTVNLSGTSFTGIALEAGAFEDGSGYMVMPAGGGQITTSPPQTGAGADFRNGVELNPVANDVGGLDGRVPNHTAARSMPDTFTVVPGDIVVKMASVENPGFRHGVGEIGVLHVLNASPPTPPAGYRLFPPPALISPEVVKTFRTLDVGALVTNRILPHEVDTSGISAPEFTAQEIINILKKPTQLAPKSFVNYFDLMPNGYNPLDGGNNYYTSMNKWYNMVWFALFSSETTFAEKEEILYQIIRIGHDWHAAMLAQTPTARGRAFWFQGFVLFYLIAFDLPIDDFMDRIPGDWGNFRKMTAAHIFELNDWENVRGPSQVYPLSDIGNDPNRMGRPRYARAYEITATTSNSVTFEMFAFDNPTSSLVLIINDDPKAAGLDQGGIMRRVSDGAVSSIVTGYGGLTPTRGGLPTVGTNSTKAPVTIDFADPHPFSTGDFVRFDLLYPVQVGEYDQIMLNRTRTVEKYWFEYTPGPITNAYKGLRVDLGPAVLAVYWFANGVLPANMQELLGYIRFAEENPTRAWRILGSSTRAREFVGLIQSTIDSFPS